MDGAEGPERIEATAESAARPDDQVTELRQAVARLTEQSRRDAGTITALEARLDGLEARRRPVRRRPGALRSLFRRLVPQPRPLASGRKKIAVIAWNMAANPVGRAYLLAEMLARRHDVELIGPSFPMSGADEIWEPIAASPIRKRYLRGRDFPDFLSDAERLADSIDADVIYVCKPRLPAMLVGLLARERLGAPLIVDVDDRELAFVRQAEPMSLAEYDERPPALENWVPKSATWTQLCDSLTGEADLVTTPNPVLQARYGGIIIRHARSESVFDPALVDRAAERARFGYGEGDRVVLFLGTPRMHKGIADVATALDRIGNPRYAFAIVGGLLDDAMRAELARYPRARIDVFGPEPFGRLADTVAIGDLVCLLQDPDSPVVTAQTPAKVTDALAMNVPVLANRVPPLADLFDNELIVEADEARLDEQIATLLERPPTPALARFRRDRFLAEFSYVANLDRLDASIAKLKPGPLGTRQKGLLERIRRRFGPAADLAAPSLVRRLDPPLVDIVLLRGAEGARLGALGEGLAASERVRRVMVIDGPVSAEALEGRAENEPKLSRRKRREAMRHLSAGEDEGKTIHRVFVHLPSATRSSRERDFPAFVKSVLDEAGMRTDSAVMIADARHRFLRHTIEAVQPRASVIDVADRAATLDPRTFGRASTVIAADRALLVRAKTVSQNAHLLPDGVPFTGSFPEKPSAPLDVIGKEPGKLVGVAMVAAPTDDTGLLTTLASLRPDWRFIGLTDIGAAARPVRFFDASRMSVAKRRDVVRSLDAALVAGGIDPDADERALEILVASFLAEGVPTVSAGPIGWRLPDEAIATAEGAERLAVALDSAIAGDRAPRAHPTLAAWLMADSWRARAERLLALVDRHVAP